MFDFHALRCQCATLADQAGASPQVVRRLMRHSTLELTGRYTRPRVAELDSAVLALPSLRPEPARRESHVSTGTDDSAKSAAAGATDNDDGDPNVEAHYGQENGIGRWDRNTEHDGGLVRHVIGCP